MEYRIKSGTLTGIADAIRGKTGESGLIPVTGMAEAISRISEGSSGGSNSAQRRDINFYDFDGTLVESWALSDLPGKTDLPDNPTHGGLAARGWNWTLEDLKTRNKPTDVGQMYATADGKTRLYITIPANSIPGKPPARNVVPLYITQTVANGVSIDWGDGSVTETLPGTGGVNTTHTYETAGDFIITLDPAEGCVLGFGNNSYGYCVMGSSDSFGRVYCNTLRQVFVGSNVIGIGDYAFSYCYSLSSVVLPEGVTSIGVSAFSYCHSLKSIVLPEGVTSIGGSAFSSCYSLSSVVLPKSLPSIEAFTFNACRSLSSIVLSEDVASIGSSALADCTLLSSIVLPESVTSIGNAAFKSCYSLKSIALPESVTSIGDDIFSGCSLLGTIILPKRITAIGARAFTYCNALNSIVLSEGVATIGSSAFSSCVSLSSVVLPKSVTAIGSSAFSSCGGVKEYHFLPAVPPDLSNKNAFNSIASDCIIYVPAGSLEAYQAAENWATYASYIREDAA